jgi:heterodisulfide reductase subunit B
MISPGQKVYSYFPGCSLETTNKAYDVSTRNVARVLGLEMIEVPDWNCCGATAYMSIDDQRAMVLSARNLALAESQARDLVAVCSGCYVVLNKANHRFQDDAKLRDRVRFALQAGDMDYRGTVRVRHFLDVVVNDLGKEAIGRHVVKRLAGLKVACYYGCQITRPYAEFDDAEIPTSMDRLMSWLGATPVDFQLRTKCCGGMLMTIEEEVGLAASGSLLALAKKAGADAIATACPLCQVNLEAYQDEITARRHADSKIPVLYFTQILGIALGLGAKELLLGDSLTAVEELFARKVEAS